MKFIFEIVWHVKTILKEGMSDGIHKHSMRTKISSFLPKRVYFISQSYDSLPLGALHNIPMQFMRKLF